ncbi:MAG TPA: glycosyltransferase family 2 protein [Anaerohalosphaeraceae bacterium]|nr:glycosyltransferase family 2 protein [Anaerohalosphaeraceae bacterium]
MNAPLVTVSSAFYNTGPMLLDMVRSVFSQTFTDWELVLVDDGSTDDSLQIARSVQDPRVRVYSNGRNLGRAASLNRITELARGKYIARLDSDDLCSPHRIQKQVELIESDPKIDVVGTGMCFLGEQDQLLGFRRAIQGHSNICAHPTQTFHIAHGTILGKKTWFQKFRYDERLPMAVDFNLFLRAHRESIYENVPDPLYYYRFHMNFNLRKQYIARRVSAAFLRDYYWKQGQYSQAVSAALAQYVKLGITAGMFSLGLRRVLMKRRFGQMSEQEREYFLDEICRIKNYSLPGF